MAPETSTTDDLVLFDAAEFDALLTSIRASGFTPVGPVRRDEALVYDELRTAGDLPAGITDVQDNGRYRVEKRQDEAWFGFNLGPHSWKKFLLPPQFVLWRSERHENGIAFSPGSADPPRLAFIGVRGCELAAIAIQDRVLQTGPYPDVHYAARREGAFIVAVNCSQAGGTCFCTSMGTGPACGAGADVVLTEILDAGHRFAAAAATSRGAAVLERVATRPATQADRDAVTRVLDQAAAGIRRQLDTNGLAAKLQANLQSPYWERVAERCLSCANCTAVCPTCFCTEVADLTDLGGEHAEHVRTWDSCFNIRFSYMHGGAVRGSRAGRYRQWLTHKLANWQEQFGTHGCVGCGRCITWCPAGIDLTAEAVAVSTPQASAGAPENGG